MDFFPSVAVIAVECSFGFLPSQWQLGVIHGTMHHEAEDNQGIAIKNSVAHCKGEEESENLKYICFPYAKSITHFVRMMKLLMTKSYFWILSHVIFKWAG